jgi:tetratricopeptide (TPR) repeat protein
LGTAYYGKEKNAEAMLRFKQAAQTADTKAEKHKAFHNLGNTYMNEKKYTEAVEAYKNALRNNPNDDETRYNLALAKDMLEKNPPPPQDDKQDDKDQKDKKDDKDKKDEKDKQDQDKQNEGDKGDQKENQDKGDENQEKKEGDKDKDQGQPDQPKDEKGDKPQQQQPVPGQLSPQQVKSLLEAMNNEEKKTQDKINAEKQKGAKVKTDKDW